MEKRNREPKRSHHYLIDWNQGWMIKECTAVALLVLLEQGICPAEKS